MTMPVYLSGFLLLMPPGCKTTTEKDVAHEIEGEMVFHSGFEPESRIVNQSAEGADIVGRDLSLPPPNDWETDLEGRSGMGEFSLQYQGGDSTQRLARITEDPGQSGNHVLQYWMRRPNVDIDKAYGGKFRIQSNLYGNQGLHEFSYRVRMYLSRDWQLLVDREEEMGWFILAEYWNNAGWTGEDHVFRMHLTINKDIGRDNPLYFGISAQTKPGSWTDYWHAENRSFLIPLEEWINLDVFFREGDRGTGRFRLLVTDPADSIHTIFDIRDFTHHPEDPGPDGMKHLNPMKGYSHRDNIIRVNEAGGILQILWDDFEFRVKSKPAG